MWKLKTVVGNVEVKNGKERLVQSDYAVLNGWLWKYILVHNFDEQLTVMLPLGVQREMSKLVLKEILGECTYVCMCARVCLLSQDVNWSTNNSRLI